MNREQITNQYLELRGCKIKRGYTKKSDARVIAKRMNRKSEGGRLRAYSCNYCTQYHVGHIRPSYEDRKQNEHIENVLKNAI